jgi:hypothetical protein
MKSSIYLLLGLFVVAPVSASDEWIKIAESDTAKFSVKVATLEMATNKAGDDVVSAIGRTEYADKKINVYKMYVRTTDCDAGYGKLVTLDTSGTFQYDNDFAFGSGNIGSSMAEALCYFYKAVQEERRKKSL